MSYLYSALEIDAKFLNTTGQISTFSDAANRLFSSEEPWEDKYFFQNMKFSKRGHSCLPKHKNQ